MFSNSIIQPLNDSTSVATQQAQRFNNSTTKKMNQPRTRQELYDLIKESGKQEFILSEMKRKVNSVKRFQHWLPNSER